MIFARQALLPSGWMRDVRVMVDSDGRVMRVDTDSVPQPQDSCVDTLLPAPGNLHSHTFQRAMAGLTGRRGSVTGDSFWTWRDLMYRFANRLTPEQIEAIAAMAFMQMQEAGYAAVGEFHYLHHQPDGTPHDDNVELSTRIFAAAATTGIGLTHLPVLYTYGGAGRAALGVEQRRFGNGVDGFGALVGAAQRAMQTLPPDSHLGIAPHSLRATAPDDLRAVLAQHGGGPVHMHIAEQVREVEDVAAWLGARPVEWLLDNAPVGPDWCLIHATHMTDAEARALAATGAVAGLCPVTEADLGDGIFDGAAWQKAEGAFGVGTDSNVAISLNGELRMLEYSQRLHTRSRNVMMGQGETVGESLYSAAVSGAARALGRKTGHIAPGYWADLLAIDSTDPALCALSPPDLLDGFIFSAGPEVVTDLWSAGRHQVRGGRHVARDRVTTAYRRAMTDLMEAA